MNRALLDVWSIAHAATGVGVGVAGIRPGHAAAGAILFEIAEHTHEWPKGSKLFGTKRPESLVNVIGDFAAFAGGYTAGHTMREKDNVPEWFPFALVASGMIAIAAGARSGWKTRSSADTSTTPPVTQASFP